MNSIILWVLKQEFCHCLWWIHSTLYRVTHFYPLWTVVLFTIERMNTSRWHLHGRRDSLFKHTACTSSEVAPGRFITLASSAQQLAQSRVFKVHFRVINPPRLMQHHTSGVWTRTWSFRRVLECTDVSLGVVLSNDCIVDDWWCTIRYAKNNAKMASINDILFELNL